MSFAKQKRETINKIREGERIFAECTGNERERERERERMRVREQELITMICSSTLNNRKDRANVCSSISAQLNYNERRKELLIIKKKNKKK